MRQLDAVHSAGSTYGTGGYLDTVKGKSSMAIEPSQEAYRHQVHPVVTRHPETGREVLYVNSVYTARIDGWSNTESAGLLGHVHRHSVNENFTCRLQVAAEHAGDLGQPVHPAQRPERLSGRASRDVPHERRRNAPDRGAGDRGCLTRRGAIGPRPPRRPSTNRRSRAFPPVRPDHGGNRSATISGSSVIPPGGGAGEALVHRRANPWWRRILRMFVLLVILGGLLIAGSSR